MSNRYADFPKIHLPFFAGERIQMIRKPKVKAMVIEASSRKSSCTGAWYKVQLTDAIEFISGHEWRRMPV